MKKLYNVNINTDMVVYAADEIEARNIAIKNVKKDLKNTLLIEFYEYIDFNEFKIKLIKSNEDIPKTWGLSCIPWGIKEDKNISQILLDLKNN